MESKNAGSSRKGGPDFSLGGVREQIERRLVKETYQQYGKSLYHHIRQCMHDPEEASDVFQDTFCVVSRRAMSLNLMREPQSYVKTVAVNLVRAWYHNRQQKHSLREQLSLTRRQPGHSPEFDLVLAVEDALRKLPERVQKVFLMRMHQQLPFETIAGQLDISQRTAKRDMSEAKKILRQVLGD